MSDSFFDTIIMDNSHDPKNVDGEALAVHPDVDSPVHVYDMLWCDILYILIEHRMYLILIINHNLILCDHEIK